jgi:hypothetical protein
MAKYKNALFSLFLSASASVIQQRAFTEGENLVLADCGIGTQPNPTDSTSRQMMYYSGDVWNPDGSANRPTMMVNVPWDGSYPWRNGGVSAVTPNGDKFTALISPKATDPSVAGFAFHTYDPHSFLCFSLHKDRLYQLDDGTWCSSAYVCNHKQTPPQPGPPPPAHEGTDTTFSVKADIVRIRNGAVQNILGQVSKAQKEGSRDCVEQGIDIGDGCSISFQCHGAGESSVANMAQALLGPVMNSKGFSSYEEEHHQVCVRPDTRPGHEGQCQEYKDVVDSYLVMPQNVTIHIDNIPAPGSPDNPSLQAWMNYGITCNRSSWSCDLCKVIGAGLDVISAADLPWAVGAADSVVNGICGSVC